MKLYQFKSQLLSKKQLGALFLVGLFLSMLLAPSTQAEVFTYQGGDDVIKGQTRDAGTYEDITVTGIKRSPTGVVKYSFQDNKDKHASINCDDYDNMMDREFENPDDYITKVVIDKNGEPTISQEKVKK